jgi:sporulation protein YlmC with PRC-barrel domain
MRILLTSAAIVLAATQFASAQTAAPSTAMPSTTIPTAGLTGQHFIKLTEEAKLSSNLVGLDIVNSNNDTVGTIKDVAMDQTGIKAYILSVGGFLGMGTHYVAVVPSEVKVMYKDSDKKWHGTINATKDELKAAPEFKYEGMWNASKS